MKEQIRPRIGITMRIELETERFYLARYYSEAVEAAGGLPVHIPLIPRADYIRRTCEGLDGILLPGSDSDVDPLRYGHEPHPQIGGVHPIKDETDLLVLEEVDTRGMPLFAICFGIQILNVFRGGTLIQDVPSQHPKAINHQQGAPRGRQTVWWKLWRIRAMTGLCWGFSGIRSSVGSGINFRRPCLSVSSRRPVVSRLDKLNQGKL